MELRVLLLLVLLSGCTGEGEDPSSDAGTDLPKLTMGIFLEVGPIQRPRVVDALCGSAQKMAARTCSPAFCRP